VSEGGRRKLVGGILDAGNYMPVYWVTRVQLFFREGLRVLMLKNFRVENFSATHQRRKSFGAHQPLNFSLALFGA
jgi:hypothetical protein